MFMLRNKWKTMVLACLVVGFFCFLGTGSVVLATTSIDGSSIGEAGSSDLAIDGTVKIGDKETKWGGTLTLTPDDSFFVSSDKKTAAFNIYYSEKNNGETKASNYRNEITFDGKMVSQQTNRSLAGLASSNVWTQAYFTTGEGTHEMVLTLDADSGLREDNKANNTNKIYIVFSGFTRDTVVVEEAKEILPANNETRSSENSRESTQAREVTQSREVTQDVFTRMSCGDSSGGDGEYSLCKGDTLYHDTGITIYNRSYDANYLKVKTEWLQDEFIRLPLNVPVSVDTKLDQITFVLTYKSKSDKYGAFLDVSHKEKQVEEVETVVPATNTESEKTSVRTCYTLQSEGKRIIAFGDSKVYYAFRGFKYWFPNEEIYMSWFNNFAGITVVSQSELASYTTGDSVCKNTANIRVSEGNNISAEVKILPAYDEAKLAEPARKRFERRVAEMSCGDSEGGDGLYSGCKGNTIFHRSGVEIMIRAYDDGVVKFMLKNANKSYVRTSLGKAVQVDSEGGAMTLKLTYKEKSTKHGAFVQVDTSFNETSSATDVESSTTSADEKTADNDVGGAKSSSEPEVTEVVSGINIDFKVSVNDYPEHKNYELNKNIVGYVNMYYVDLQADKTFKVGEADIKGTVAPVDGGDPVAVFTVAPGKMVYFEGFKSYDNALQGVNDKMAINWSAPPYKNFSSGNRIKDKLCQTNFANTDTYLSCSNNLSTPYID